MNKIDLINSIKKNFQSVQEMKIENAQAFAVSIRSSLEFAVKLFWQEKLGQIPTWTSANGRSDFNLNEALRDSRFSDYFERWTITYMHLIRQDCNDIIHGHKNLTVGTAKELIENLEKCLNAMEKLLGYSLIAPVTPIKEVPPMPKTTPKTNPNPTPPAKPISKPALKPTVKEPPKAKPTPKPTKTASNEPKKVEPPTKSRMILLEQTKRVVLRFMQIYPDCGVKGQGLAQTAIFDACGFNWGHYTDAPESDQEYWFLACLKDLEKDKVIGQDKTTKKWRLTVAGTEAKVDISEFAGLKVREVGEKIRKQSRGYVYEYMKSKLECSRNGTGLYYSELFLRCGFNWGDYVGAESFRQQYWFMALLRSLEKDGWAQCDPTGKRWKLL